MPPGFTDEGVRAALMIRKPNSTCPQPTPTAGAFSPS
jgi:acid phosphatase class B